MAPGSVEAHAVDVLLLENAKGDVTRRFLDGGRLVAMDECGVGSSLEAGCVAYDRTMYGYLGTDDFEILYDAVAVASSDWTATPSATGPNR